MTQQQHRIMVKSPQQQYYAVTNIATATSSLVGLGNIITSMTR
jgi:hypothetical protein